MKVIAAMGVSIAALGLGMAPLPAAGASAVFEGPVPRADCHGDPMQEDALQGEVPLKDRNDGRSQLGYKCNLALVGQHQGQGAGWQNAWYDHCDYYDTKTASGAPGGATPGNGNGNGQTSPGTQVMDVSNPAHPVLTTNLDTPAMDGPWESLKVNQKRGLLAGVGGFGSDGDGPLYFDVYDVKGDCAHPKLLSSSPIDIPIGHEGNWAPDGMTYYGTSIFTGTIAAIDVTDPTQPSWITTWKNASINHGVALSDDGKTLYAADPSSSNGGHNGLDIIDVGNIQGRSGGMPSSTPIGSVYWTDGSTAQHPIPVFYGTHPYIVFVDEGGAGAARIIDIADPKNPAVISKLKLQIHMPANATVATADTNGNGLFTYQGHYCAVDREYDPTAVACGYFQSGIRVFDIRDPHHPREIAYYNPPAQVAKHGQLPGSEHDGGPNNGNPPNMTADWCSSQVRFYTAPDGSHQLWAQCQDNGFMVLKFTNNAYPLASASTRFSAPAPPTSAAAGVATPNTSTGAPSPVVPATLLVLGAGLFALNRRARSKPG